MKEPIESSSAKEKEASVDVKKETESTTSTTANNGEWTDEMIDKLVLISRKMRNISTDTLIQEKQFTKFEDILKSVGSGAARMERMCGSCHLVWRIKDYKTKFVEARQGERPVIYSPAFDTHRYGYRIALSLCPNGDGKGRGKYISLFFCLLKGDYDALLAWPFCQNLSFTMLDQSGQGDNIDANFTTNPIPENIAFLGKPTTYRNPSLGLPRFAKLHDVWGGKYVVNDSMYIKVDVDLSGVLPV